MLAAMNGLGGKIATAVLILVVGAAAVLWAALQGTLPQTEGRRTLPGLAGEVTVLRDARGIPTIRADGADDAYAALGFLHAQDRLWQMEMMRRFGQGRLSQVAGKATLRIDRFARALDLHGRAARMVPRLPENVREALAAYADGVNAFLESRRGPLPVEFQLTGVEPAPWRPADSLVWGKLMALRLSGDWRTEQLKSRLLQRLAPDRVADLLPGHGDSPASLTAAELAAAGDAPRRLADAAAPPAALSAPDASNAWTLAGARTAGGAPILANDPHLGLRLPATWYMARIETPDLTLAGATAPGVPFHVLGHNGTAAWGLTTTHADSMDLIALEPDPADPETRYLTADGPKPYESEVVEIPLGDGEKELFERRSTVFGPVLPDETPRVALQWAALKAPDRTATALYRLNRATDRADFEAAARRFDAPVQNLFYADRHGTTAMAVAGRLPERAPGRSGALPRPSDAPDAAWRGVTDPADTPVAANPADGVIANANNKALAAAAAPYPIARDWPAPYRYARVRERLAATSEDHTPQDSAAVQQDVVSRAARDLLPHMLEAADPDGELARDALARLAVWDGAMTRDAAAPAIYRAWIDELARVLAEDELGPDFQRWWRADPAFLETALTRKTVWCDDVRTPTTEDCGWALATSLARATARLKDRLGADIASWRWGALHVAPLGHRLFRYVPVLGTLAGRPIETPGGDHTANRGRTEDPGSDTPFAHVHGAGLRAVYDLSAPDDSLFALAGGQSGNPVSPHYADGVVPWRDGRYFRIPGRTGDIAATDLERLILQPD